MPAMPTRPRAWPKRASCVRASRSWCSLLGLEWEDEPCAEALELDWHQPDLLANFDFNRATTGGGTKDDTSPPIEAIWRTSVAVIGRTAGEAGRNTVWRSGAMAPFMPAISIS